VVLVDQALDAQRTPHADADRPPVLSLPAPERARLFRSRPSQFHATARRRPHVFSEQRSSSSCARPTLRLGLRRSTGRSRDSRSSCLHVGSSPRRDRAPDARRLIPSNILLVTRQQVPQIPHGPTLERRRARSRATSRDRSRRSFPSGATHRSCSTAAAVVSPPTRATGCAC
jgi:hypothetical protein